jgi:hypothetical protein
MNNDSSIETVSEVLPKRGRGRPVKYSLEEKQEKKREYCKTWYVEHKERHNENNRAKYHENPEKFIQETCKRQGVGRDAFRLLSDLWKSNLIHIEDEKYRNMIEDLIVHEKRIYA